MHGQALAIEVLRLRSLVRESPPLRAACAAYAEAFLREALQTAACNSVHMVEERCARWLLMSHDRSDGDTITLTQEYLAEMLGVCRTTVTLAAGALQRAGLIRYRRGAIVVLDRPGLEAVSCECYRVIRDHYHRLLPRTYERQTVTHRRTTVLAGPRLVAPSPDIESHVAATERCSGRSPEIGRLRSEAVEAAGGIGLGK